MNGFFFILVYLLSPAIPVAMIMSSIGGGLDAYSFSVLLGVYAFVLFCNQLILASRPRFAVSALGLKGLLAFHGAAPLFIIGIAFAHRMLKALAGFDLWTSQAILGLIVLLVFLLASVAAFLFLANIPGALGNRLRSLRAWADKTFRFGYKVSRAMHSITVVGLTALAVHVALASSVAISVNPLTAAWLAAWFLLSLGLYVRYRLLGRPTPKISAIEKQPPA